MRAVAVAPKDRLQQNAGSTPVKQYVSPTTPLPYIWLPESVTVTQGRSRFEKDGTFQIFYRAKGKQAVETLAQAGDFIDGLVVPEFGDALGLRYSLNSRIGPEDDPNVPETQLIVDTYSCVFVNARSPAVAG